MSRLFNGVVPIVGKDQFGNPINLVVDKEASRIVQARNVQSIGANEATVDPKTEFNYIRPKFNVIEVKAIYSKDNKTLALGDGDGTDLSFTNVNGSWVIGQSPVSADNIRPNGIAYTNENFVVASPNNTVISSFKYNSNTPASNGVVMEMPDFKKAALGGVSVDNLSAGTTVMVAGSLTSAGTWTVKADLPGDEWGRHVGEQELILTNVRGTSYTFPGYAKANPQIQRVCALPNGDKPPYDWTTGDDRTNGYYGVIGGPSITVSWTKA